MKGLTHFISGVATATFFSQAVQQSLDEQSFLLVLGGICGMLPDTFDFKLARFFEQPDIELDLDPQRLDPQQVADTVAHAVGKAHESGKTIHVAFHSLQMGPDAWRQYRFRFNNEAQRVEAEIGPLVSTSQVPFDNTEPAGEQRAHTALPCLIDQTYSEDTVIDIFSGPTIGFAPTADGKISAEFIPWHRRWSHSLTLAMLLGALFWLLLGPLAGIIAASAFSVHVLEDQLGHMGSNLFFPLTKTRMQGLGWMRSGDALPNLMTVWLMASIILFNLNRFHSQPPITMHPLLYFGAVFVVPAALIIGIATLLNAKKRARHSYDETNAEMEEEF